MTHKVAPFGFLLFPAWLALASVGCGRDCTTCVAVVAQSTPQNESAFNLTILPQATFGDGVHRNMVNRVEKNIATDWSVEDKKFKNIKWVAQVGTVAHCNPVIFGGRVFVATNNKKPRDPKIKGEKGVLMCFAEKDGAFLWQNVHAMPPDEVVTQALPDGVCCTPTVEGDFVYYCGPACDVIKADVKDGKIVWRYDMMKELKVYPCFLCAGSPLVIGDLIFVMTGNGANDDHKIPAPKAPSFVAISKESGKLVWQSNLPGENIIEGQWSCPVYAEANGKPQIIFPGGDGYLYALEPKTGKMIWKFKCSPTQTEDDRGIAGYFLATPVVHGQYVYASLGAARDYSPQPKIGHFFCIDITKTGDVSCKNENFDPKDPANKDSALVWHFGGMVKPPPEKGRKVRFGTCSSTPSVHDGLVYVAEENGYLQCLDARTGERYWEHDFKTAILGSTYWVDGKIYICSHDGECHIFEHGKKYQPPRSIDMDDSSLESTPVAANGILYILTPSKLYAIGAK